MTYPWAPPLLAAIAILALGIVVHQRGPRTELNQVFTFLAVTLVFWNLNFFVLYSASDPVLTFRLIRVFRVGNIFMLPAIPHLVMVLRERRSRFWRTAMIADYGFSCVLVVLNTQDLLVSGLHRVAWGYSSVAGPLLNLFSFSAVANCLAALAVLVYDFWTSTEPRSRLQLKFWLAGALVALPLGCTNLLPAYGVPLYPLGNLGNAAWAAIVAYAIVRHRLMDIDIVITKGMAYMAVGFALIAPAFGLTLWLQQLSFGRIHPDFSTAILLMFVVVGLLFPTLRLRAESRIERSLFREKHEYRVALSEFARSIVRILDRDKLLGAIATTLSSALHLDRLAIALFDGAERTYSVSHATGIPAATAEFPESHAFVAALRRRDEVVLREELEASATPAERPVVTDICQRNGWEVCIPLSVGGKLIGFISLGRKRNLDAFSAEDLQLLATLGAEAAIALENARLYEELKKSRDIIHRTGRLSALGTLAAGIAHEVRNPLVSIQTFFQLAPQRIHDEEFFTTFLNLTAGEVQRISDLISELLTFAKSSAHAVQDVDVNDLIERTTILLEPEARKHRIALTRELFPELPHIRADADQVKQIVINLVLNAIQATPHGGSVSVLTRRVTRHDGIFCQIEVRDTGAGIPQKMIEDIFNPFFTTKDKGTGLGLSIANQIATEHGGFIAVTSEEDRGSSFCVYLPVAGAGAAPADGAAEEELPLRYGRMAKL
jgi:signal transduction histidine kinase